jgi:pimeloyl-ACP methyl ester carboxylesterase
MYILIHGTWHASWCWKRVAPLIKGKGYKVLAPDLPGHGEDRTKLKDILFELANALTNFKN